MELTAKVRNELGKSVRKVRADGFIPAVLYGHGISNIHMSVEKKAFQKLFKQAGESTVITLSVDGKKHPTLVHDVQKDYLSGDIQHIDFYEVRMDEAIRTHVQIVLTGEAPAVREQGGVLNYTMTEIEVEALPGDLPHEISVDISGLKNIDESIRIGEIKLPKGVKVLVGPETVIVSIAPPMKEEEPLPVAVDVTQVKVETEEKKLERNKDKEEKEA